MPPTGPGAAPTGPTTPAAPLDAARLRAALRDEAALRGGAAPRHDAGLGGGAAGPGVPATIWTDIHVVASTGSTNEDVLKQAASGAPEGLVIAAESQTAGKGRLGRAWHASPGAALTFSVLLRPRSVPLAARGWVPLLAGVATVQALRQATGVRAGLKWPNDVLAGGGKLAGILAEQLGDAIVVGIGINVLGRADELPVATATSLERCGSADADRTVLLAALLRRLEHWYLRWRETGSGDAAACGLRRAYLSAGLTMGRQVRVQLPGSRVLTGTATDVDGAGQLLVRPAPGSDCSGLPLAGTGGEAVLAISAGDVIHVR